MAEANNASAHDAPAPAQIEELRRLMGGFRVSQALRVVAELGIADLLADGPRASDALAAAAGANEDALYRVLRLLAGAGLFDEVAPRRFALTALGAGLRRDVPGSLHANVVNTLDDQRWLAWGQLLAGVRTGEVPFERVHGMGMFDYFESHPESAARFNRAMTGESARAGDAIARAYDFAGIGRLVDVGGGHGQLLATILRAYPALRGGLFDLPAVVADAGPVLAAAGVADRCEVVGGDFFAAVAPGGDAYLLRSILHDWDDARATAILANCRRALPSDGKILAVERAVAPDYRRAMPALHLDLQMFALLGGKERTEAEYRALFAAAGLRLSAVVPADDKGQFSIYEGVPA